jgi:hypothetical protein
MEDKHQFESVLQAFADSVASQEAAIQAGDAKTANSCGRRYVKAANELLSSDSGIEAFATLLQDGRLAVRSAAATCLLPHRTREAIVVLEEAAKSSGVIGLGALMTLARWSRGEKGMWNEVSRIAASAKLPEK